MSGVICCLEKPQLVVGHLMGVGWMRATDLLLIASALHRRACEVPYDRALMCTPGDICNESGILQGRFTSEQEAAARTGPTSGVCRLHMHAPTPDLHCLMRMLCVKQAVQP
jgi:hypothetical protein